MVFAIIYWFFWISVATFALFHLVNCVLQVVRMFCQPADQEFIDLLILDNTSIFAKGIAAVFRAWTGSVSPRQKP